MKRWLTAALIGIASLNGRAIAEDTFTAGAGSVACSEFSKHYAENPKFFGTLFFAWAQGYMSGLNTQWKANGDKTVTASTEGKTMDLLSVSTERQEAAIRKYCTDHTSALYSEAVFNLYVALRPNSSPANKARPPAAH